jgi:hypothetical protein
MLPHSHNSTNDYFHLYLCTSNTHTAPGDRGFKLTANTQFKQLADIDEMTLFLAKYKALFNLPVSAVRGLSGDSVSRRALLIASLVCFSSSLATN